VNQCESDNFTPVKFSQLYFFKFENFESRILHAYLLFTSTPKCKVFSIILKFDKVAPPYARSLREYFPFSQSSDHKTETDNKQMVKCTNCWDITITKTAKHILYNIF